ncbi:GIY-YIG nuclease family protein [Enterococcus hulanensis]|uniref:GIY-YIG nuclease family protein n=1 Tax=Enterococcus hulanensis TaxID=2559929 RepID=A0ABU3EWG1_9ENTE|nr:GIY-YIG nuclease family protein [Enterococcus hulanensis]MDT2599001.1 GIY-YIG nuclease family protein [Enterococcus hulanensis]MDT2610652.1 GIY-YIG nuclease family protein [Enterococcus hulanensis]MDT2614790.1 GIY-YIG nuclease family protein [Enterococcus hulanensis]MDT2627240.1 GIY-YIG nuclease family protein [Enterococcus hulanensis]MDT2653860.1 GIY-YIG nuclease family protein [Enterococcus hulanensis]
MLKEKIKNLPKTPGIYKMKNSHGEIIYVGKAKNLKQRVSSYFIQNKQHSRKVQEMVRWIADFDYELTATEFDALLLECHLIHQIRPRYNRMMNYYEGYGYFQFIDKAPYLKVLSEWSEEGLVIGPFYKQSKIQELKEIINSTYRLDGPLKYVAGIVKNYDEISPEAEFDLRIQEIKETLLGQSTALLTRIDQRVQAASERHDYEASAQWWNNYLTVQRFLRRNKQLIQIMQNQTFVGILPEDGVYYCYLYAKGELLNRVVYQREPSIEQAKKRLEKGVSAKTWQRLEAKERLDKADVDLFPIFFNYLNQHGQVRGFSPQEK